MYAEEINFNWLFIENEVVEMGVVKSTNGTSTMIYNPMVHKVCVAM